MVKRSVINRLLLAMPLALFASIAGSAAETVKIEIGPYRLDVPEYNAYLNGNIIPWLRFMVGADDDSRSATLLFSNEELEASIPGYVIPKTVQGLHLNFLANLIDPNPVLYPKTIAFSIIPPVLKRKNLNGGKPKRQGIGKSQGTPSVVAESASK